MGSAQSSTTVSPQPLLRESSSDDDDEEEEEDEEVEVEDDMDDEDPERSRMRRLMNPKDISIEKVLEQEPEILPCRAAASPLSPQPSAAGTPRLHMLPGTSGASSGPSIKVWDPCNVLLPPPRPISLALFGRSGTATDRVTKVLLVAHGECASSLRPDLVGGRWASAAGLTPNGERQARALAVFLKSQGESFGEVYCSPLDRARATAAFVCRELGFAEEQINLSDALTDISQGQWEGCLRAEVYTPEMVNLIDRTQPDFCAPSGESLRQVVFRMIEFLNRTVIRLPERLAIGETGIHQHETNGLSRNSSTNSVQERDGPHWDLLYRLNRPELQKKKSGKSRLQFVTTGGNEIEDEFSPGEITQENLLHDGNRLNPSLTIGIFTHAIPIKCVLTGLLDCSPAKSNTISIDDSSVTILQHSLKTGWQIERINDTAHLRLL